MHTHRFPQHDDPVCQVTHELQEVQGGVQVTLRVTGTAVGSPTAKSMSSGRHMILKSLEANAESGRPPLGTRLISAMFDRLEFVLPARTKIEYWSL